MMALKSEALGWEYNGWTWINQGQSMGYNHNHPVVNDHGFKYIGISCNHDWGTMDWKPPCYGSNWFLTSQFEWTGYEMLLQCLGLVHVGTCKWGWAPNLWQFRAGSMMIEHFNSVVQTNLSIEIDVVRDCHIPHSWAESASDFDSSAIFRLNTK